MSRALRILHCTILFTFYNISKISGLTLSRTNNLLILCYNITDEEYLTKLNNLIHYSTEGKEISTIDQYLKYPTSII